MIIQGLPLYFELKLNPGSDHRLVMAWQLSED